MGIPLTPVSDLLLISDNAKQKRHVALDVNDEKPFHIRLREWRGALQIKEAAILLGVNPRTYAGWEGGWSRPSNALSMREVEHRMRETAHGTNRTKQS